jgi:hypothetical protein
MLAVPKRGGQSWRARRNQTMSSDEVIGFLSSHRQELE